MTPRGPLFVAWGATQGRSQEIAAALGGEAVCMYPPASTSRPPVAVRYVVSMLRTVAQLIRKRPRAVVVTNPPIVPGLVALGWARLTRGIVVLDSHTGAFGVKGNRASAILMPVHRFVARRADVCLVAAPQWQRMVESWGGRAIVVHEAPGVAPRQGAKRHHLLRVLYVCTFAPDEPVEDLLSAARAMPECHVVVTGNVPARLSSPGAQVPPNVEFVGYLDSARYRAQLEEADVVVALTTEPNSVMRAAYEAVYAERPLIVSDWPIARELFPYALFAHNDASSLATALRRAREEHATLVTGATQARVTQLRRWEDQLEELTSRILTGRTRTPVADGGILLGR